jgi:hypothetical protein
VAQQLIRELGIDEYLNVPQCDRKTPPYSPSNKQGWNISPGECFELNYLYASHTIAWGHIVLLFVCLFVCSFVHSSGHFPVLLHFVNITLRFLV